MPPRPSHPQLGRTVIAGFGLVSPLGLSAWDTFAALLAGRTLADRAAALPRDVAPVDLVRAVGAVAAARHGADDPAVELAERAAREACFMAGADPAGLPTFLGTSKGAVGGMVDGRWSMRDVSESAANALMLGPHGYLTHRLRHRLGLGLARHYVAACASSLTALHHARLALQHPTSHTPHRTSNIEHRTCATALVLTAEASLIPLFIHSYRRLGVLAPLTTAQYRQCPLDQARRGFMLSETGAAVVLRRLPPGQEPLPGQIELLDTAAACEAHDLIRPSPAMPALAHVAARLLREPVDMIHPHAPGTADHDPAELHVYAEALTNQKPTIKSPPPLSPDLYAAKGALGHSLGAAGLTSLILACLCLTAGRRPPMPWLTQPLQTGPALLAPTADARPCPRAGAHAVFASGFAGHVAGALIRRH